MLTTMSSLRARVFIVTPILAESRQESPLHRAASAQPPSGPFPPGRRRR